MAQPSNPHLLDVPTLAEYLGITKRAAEVLIYQRRLPVVKIGRLSYVSRDDLAAYLARHTTPARTDQAEVDR